MPGVVVSLIIIALGSILKWGVTSHSRGFNLDTIGLILLLIGILALILSLFYEYAYLRRRPTHVREREVVSPVVEDRVVDSRRRIL